MKYNFIAIEGNIGAGKTSLAELIAVDYNAKLILEQFEDNSFDTVIASLVFCSIPDAATAAKEAFRVLKPGGRLLFFEHVRSPDQWTCRIQTFVNPLWKVFACGCSLTCDTETVFKGAGFEYKTITKFRNPKMTPPFAAWMIKGEATKPI